MSTATNASPLTTVPLAAAPSTRLASIDIMRGLTMTVMIFVNELAGVKGLPWWTYHAHTEWNVMTYVDMVYPFFLFIVGLSFPIAIRQRLKKNPSIPALWLHVLVRSLSLIVLGLILANADNVNPALTHLSPGAWAVIALLGAVLFLRVDANERDHPTFSRMLRTLGLIAVVTMFALFRMTTKNGGVSWIDFSYPEILGLIGCTYFAVAILYIPTRRWLLAPFAWLAVLIAYNCLNTAHILTAFQRTPILLWPFDNGAMAAIVMGGIATSVIFLGDHRWQTAQKKISLGASFGVINLAAGFLLIPLGISKNRATPTWALYDIGAAALLFTALYWLCDVKKRTGWAFFARPAGANTLTTYLLPDFYSYLALLFGFTWLDHHLNYGLPGVIQSVVFTAVVLVLSAVLTRMKIRLQL